MIYINYKADGSLDVDSVLIRLTTENGLALGHNGNAYVALKEDKKESGYEGKDIIEIDPKKNINSDLLEITIDNKAQIYQNTKKQLQLKEN